MSYSSNAELEGKVVHLLPPPLTIFSSLATEIEGCLLCDGKEYLKSQYPNLAGLPDINADFRSSDSTKFKVPDLREAALVGAGKSGRASTVLATHDQYNLGQFKDDQLQNPIASIKDNGHTHKYVDNYVEAGYGLMQGPGGGGTSATRQTELGFANLEITPTAGVRFGDVNRGKRVGVNFFIVY